MTKRYVKNIKTGDDMMDVISVRPQGQQVRLHDVATGQILMMTPDIARKLAGALLFGAKHAETSRPLAYELYQKQLEKIDAAKQGS